MTVFPLMLSKIREKNLLPDDSDDYALNSIPRDFITDAVSVLMNHMVTSSMKFNLKTKRRISVFMEFFAITFALDAKYADLIEYANQTYQSWILDANFLGDQAQQNKYFRKIIKHLSLAFDNKNIKSEKYLNVLNSIFDTYKILAHEKSTILEPETWRTLIMTLFAICDTIMFSRDTRGSLVEFVQKLCSKALFLVFELLFTSPYSKEYFDVFMKFSFSWSSEQNYIHAWGSWIIPAYEIIIHNAFKSPRLNQLLNNELIASILRIEIGKLPTALQLIFKATDLQTAKKSEQVSIALAEVARKATLVSIGLSKDISHGFIPLRYPIKAFLHLFGPILLDYQCKSPVLLDEINSIVLMIISNFDFTGSINELRSLVHLLIQQCNQSPSFIKNIIQAMSRPIPEDIFCSLGATSLATVDSFDFPDPDNEEYLIPLFLSACNSTKKYQPMQFMRLWDNTKKFQSKLELISQSFSFDVNLPNIIMAMMSEDSVDPELVLWLSLTLSMCVREDLRNMRNNNQVLDLFIDYTIKNKFEGESLAVILLAVLECIEWGMKSTDKMSNLVDFAFQCKDDNPAGNYAKSLAKLVIWKSAVHEPPEALKCQLAATEKREDINKYKYITVGEQVLLAITNNENKIEVIARGPFGKASFVVEDDNYPDVLPQFSEIPPESLPKPPNDLVGTKYDIDGGDKIKQPSLLINDEYSKWMKRPVRKLQGGHEISLHEFLVKSGILTTHNVFKVRRIIDMQKLSKVIESFQRTETPPILVVPVMHFMPEDTHVNANRNRTTKALQDFLNGIAPVFSVSTSASDFAGLPRFRSGIPIMPAAGNYIAFVAPELAASDDDAKKIKDIYDGARLKIIFNEADAVFTDLKNEPTFVIKPVQCGCFLVETGLKDQCFAPQQLMTAKSFSQALVIYIERRILSFNSSKSNDVVLMRSKIISELCTSLAEEFPNFN